ncbi:hypothetical protein BJ165DRAFT_1452520 [Panaeolus papilionaceus]|nr:hypothetical protein BJ165DRAFT_1452520 [Panaeolus papilionaceus]
MPFHDLPLDIYISICSFLDGLDILALGQTCSVLRAATEERSVWTRALKYAITENQISAATCCDYYDLELDKLKDVATGPSRIRAKLRQGQLPNPQTMDAPLMNFTYKRIVHAGPPSNPEVDRLLVGNLRRTFSRLCLIPGGRFLIAYSHPEVYFYDLGLGFSVKTQLDEPIRVPYDESWLFMPSPSADGKEIRLAISRTAFSPDMTETVAEASVIRFILEEPNRPPHVKRQTTTLEVPFASNPEFFTIACDLLIYSYSPNTGIAPGPCILNVWNFMDDTFASWSIPKANHLELFYDSGHVVMIDSKFLRGWKIPPLRPRKLSNPIPLQDIPETFNIPLKLNATVEASDSGSEFNLECERVYDWYSTFKPLDVFQIKSQEDDFSTWTTYTIQSRSSKQSTVASSVVLDPHDKVVVEHPYKFQISSNSHGGSLSVVSNPFLVCNDSIVRCFTYGRQPCATISSPMAGDECSNDSEPERMVELGVLEDVPLSKDLYSRVDFAFDPFSGRFAYISEHEESIVILDYLLHPGAVPHRRSIAESPPESSCPPLDVASIIPEVHRVKPCSF